MCGALSDEALILLVLAEDVDCARLKSVDPLGTEEVDVLPPVIPVPARGWTTESSSSVVVVEMVSGRAEVGGSSWDDTTSKTTSGCNLNDFGDSLFIVTNNGSVLCSLYQRTGDQCHYYHYHYEH